MAQVVFDIETNGLTPDKIWCLGYQESEGTAKVTTDPSFTFNKEHTYYGHNAIGFDYPVLSRLWGLPLRKDGLLDTLVLSRLANPSRDGGHSLDSWGTRLGYPKGEHSDWSEYTPSMRDYCKQDVRLTTKVLKVLEAELAGFDQQSIDLEHSVAWIIQKQMDNGWLLDQEKVYMLLAELKEKKFELEDEVHRVFTPRYKAVREITPKVKANGATSVVGLKFLGDDCLSLVGGVFTRVELTEFNLGSRPQIAARLQLAGWVPVKFTPKTDKGGGGNPIVDETVLAEVTGIPEAALIADYLTVVRRVAMAQSWLDHVQDDGRVHGEVNSNGAVTGRMTHYNPNMGQVTSGTKIYGKEMRTCFTVPKGYKLVGMDAKGLELRMLAHYMNDTKYTKEVVDGDPHTANQLAAGLPTRDQAKTFIYAFLYGAGDAKIGSIIGGHRKDGKKLKAKFLRNTPALDLLRKRVSNRAARGWLRGLDGRRIAVRHAHAALNSLLQGAGAVVMKQALVFLDTMATAQGLDYKFVGNIHDEVQVEVREDQAEKFGKLAAYAMVRAGEHFKLNCPLAGDYKVGDNWNETH
jgi:DNA polymerase-1